MNRIFRVHTRISTSWLALLLAFLLAGKAAAGEKPTGLVVAGLPNISYKSDQGFQYGVKGYVIQYGDGIRHPYKWNLAINATKTTKNQTETYLFLDMPQVFGPGTRMDFYLAYKNYQKDNYYGLGNFAEYELEFIQPASALFLSEDYYFFRHSWYAAIANYQFPLLPNLRGLFGAGMYRSSVAGYQRPNKLREDDPPGMDGGMTNYLRLGLIYDTRDEEAVPTRGTWSDVLVEISHRLIGSDYRYARWTLTDRRYVAIFDRLVYAQRLLLEVMPGHPPFYEMSILGNSYIRQEGLGGTYSLRGVPRFLFVGPHKLVANFEWRFRVISRTILKQPLTFYFHLFVDSGRVWLADEPKKFDHLHFSHGIGFRLQWHKDFVASLDIGRSRYQDFGIYATVGNLF